MRFRNASLALTALMIALGSVGCGGAPEGDIGAPKAPMSKEEGDAKAKALMDGMNKQYKGAPGVPAPKK